MSAHRVLFDTFCAPFAMTDPGDAGTITVDRDRAVCKVVTATTETRTLAQPTKAGLMCMVELKTDGGDLTLTVTGGYNQDDTTSITFGDVGDWVMFHSVDEDGSFYWRVLKQEGTNADSLVQDKMAPSTVIDATVEQYVSSVRTEGNLIKTEILIDLTGAASVATDKDIIGATGICHFGQITTAINGTIVSGQMTCLEVPATGADDIDLYMASVGTGAYDADGSALTNAASLITKAGAWAVAPLSAATVMTAPVTADYYLYLLSGEAVAGTYAAGKFLIELWGLPA